MRRLSTIDRIVNSIGPLRQLKWGRAAKRFCQEQIALGVHLANREVPLSIYRAKTVLIDAGLVVEGWNAVRMAAAPLCVCPIEKYRRQGSWMMLTAGVALGCDGYAPLQNFAREMNFESTRMARQYPKISEIAYDDERQMETTVHRDAGSFRAFAKGAPEAILARCTKVLDGKERALDEADRREALDSGLSMERYGLETLAFATKQMESEGEPAEAEMTFLGIVGMGDLPLETAPSMMRRLRALGIRPVFVSKTAYPENAVRVSGVLRPESGVMYGSELEGLSAEALLDAALWADAVVGADNALRRRLARALRVQGGVAIIAPMPGGEVAVSLGRSESDDATLRTGGLDAVVGLIERCYALCGEYE